MQGHFWLFELTRHPSRTLNLDVYVALDLQRYMETVRCGALGAEVPGTTDTNLDCAFVENALFYIDP